MRSIGTTFVATVTVFIFAPLMMAADRPGDAPLAQLAPLVGSWTATLDLPGTSFKEANVKFRWIADGKYLEARWYAPDGTELGPELFAWDPISRTIKMWGFDPESFYEATWQIDGKKWTGKYAGTRFSGEQPKSTITLEFPNDSEVTLKLTPEGSDEPTGTGTLTRTDNAKADHPHRQHLDAFVQDFAGEWVSESTAEGAIGPVKGGEKYSAYHSFKWSPDKESLDFTFQAQIGGKTFDTTKGIAGWDAARDAIVVRWFDSLGSTGELVYKEAGKAWQYEFESTDAKGEKSTWTGGITFEPGVQRAHDTNRVINGQARPDQHTVWTRK